MIDVAGRVAEIVAARTFVVREEIFPAPAPGQVLIKVCRVGVCASDLLHWQSGPEPGQPPLRLGHEPVGVVHAVGAGVPDIRPGQTVTGRLVPAFADYVYAHPCDVVQVPDAVDPVIAVGEPLGCVVDAYQRIPPQVGAVTAVVGLGFMGLLMTSLFALSPVAAIWGIGRGLDTRIAASRAGATHTYAPDDLHLIAGVAELVVEATGLQAGLDIASNLAADHGALSILGYHQDGSRVIDMRSWNWKGLTVMNGHVRDRHQLARSTHAGMRLLASNRLNTRHLFTHQYSLEGLNDAFQGLSSKPTGFIKSVIVL
jgi:threonine dehydrogenase-like Zn-dependent dehydrogenase